VKKQLERMHRLFGRDHAQKCGTCCNLVSGRYHDRILQKCERYGLSHSEASDWAKSWVACGMHNVPLPEGERPVMEYADRGRVKAVEAVPGQETFLKGATV